MTRDFIPPPPNDTAEPTLAAEAQPPALEPQPPTPVEAQTPGPIEAPFASGADRPRSASFATVRTPEGSEIDFELLDGDALKVVNRLQQHGHQAFLVGGCVRDLMLGYKPKDFDVATSAHPGEVRAIFRNCRLIGRRFRLAHVYFKGGKVIEVSTFRANPTEVEEAQAELEASAAAPVEPDPGPELPPVEPLDALDDGSEGELEDEGEADPVADDDGFVDPGEVQQVDAEASANSESISTQSISAEAEPSESVLPEPDEALVNALGISPVSGRSLRDAESGLSAQEQQEEEDLLITQDNVFGTAEQDARRRDFTINGLFFDVTTGKVIDYVRGRRDLHLRYMRTIGDPEVRMREDPVRILRAVRFASKLDFDIESRTYAAMEGAVEELPRCAPPRLLEETFKLVRGGVAAPSIRLLSALDALKILLPPIDAFLKAQGPEGEKVFFAHIEALDARVREGAKYEDGVLLATLLLPLARATPPAPQAQPQAGGRPPVAHAIEELLSTFVQTARLPRRIAERCRMILLAQRTLTGERRRRGSLQSFRRHPLFNEALTVFEISVQATGEHREALEAWIQGGAPRLPATGDRPNGFRRRSRRRRGRGVPNGASGPSSSDVGSNSGSNE